VKENNIGNKNPEEKLKSAKLQRRRKRILPTMNRYGFNIACMLHFAHLSQVHPNSSLLRHRSSLPHHHQHHHHDPTPPQIIHKPQARKQNPKAFVFASRGKAKIQKARTADREQKRMHVPAVEKPTEEPPPFTVLVHGPPGVGKTTLIKGLIKHYTRQDVRDPRGPITLIAGKLRRLTFLECPLDLCAMMDAAKFADLVLLLIDGSFGFEMETFEFLNILQVHGFPKVMGVLTHLDGFKDTKALKKTKKVLKHRFWTEIYQGAKLFYLSGFKNGKYLKREVHNLARFISVMKFRPLTWRQAHPYLVADRMEDVTPPAALKSNPKADRTITLYGYLRGANWRQGTKVHIAGVGDYLPSDIIPLPDPCPLPSQRKKRSLNERERLIYCPMSDVGGLLYDKDAMYIDLPDWKVAFSQSGAAQLPEPGSIGEGEAMVRDLQAIKVGLDEKLEASKIRLFAGGKELTATEIQDNDGDENRSDDEEDSDTDSGEEEDDLSSNSDDEDGDNDEDVPYKSTLPGEEVEVVADGRTRRRAIFSTALDGGTNGMNGHANDSSEEEEEDGSSSDEEDWQNRLDYCDNNNSKQEEAPWKASMFERAAALFSTRAADLQKFIYGTKAIVPSPGIHGNGTAADSDDDEDGEFFKPKKRGSATSNGGKATNDAINLTAVDALDCSKSYLPGNTLEIWGEQGAAERLRDRFVTGNWEAGEARASARPNTGGGDDDDDNDDGEVYGDFEDVEMGVKFSGSDDPATRAAAAAIHANEAEEIALKKAAKKAAFDSAYDEGGGGKGLAKESDGDADGTGAGGGKVKGKGGKQQQQDGDEEEDETYYDAMKREMTDRAAKTKAAMDALDPSQRQLMEGYRPGTYIRLRFSGIPCEFVENFDPNNPILVGGLGQGEETVGLMQLRMKRHRWFPKVLKNRDPLIFSVGWRRFQSLPVFAIKDNNERHRMLKYSPEHMHCLAAIWGPMAPPSTGVLAVQKLDPYSARWRIAATGVVMQLDASIKIVKKLKLVGTPAKIHRNTAFIQAMFNSQLEASKFEGASIRTVSGIRGTIKKAVRAGTGGMKDGTYRATFEDKPLLSDIVFLRAWVQVEIPKFTSSVTNLLAPQSTVNRGPKPQHRNAKIIGEGAGKDNGRGSDGDAINNNNNDDDDDDGELLQGIRITKDLDNGEDFQPAFRFKGAKPGFVFKTGHLGLGYYRDMGGFGRNVDGGRFSQEAGGNTTTNNKDAITKKPSGHGWVGVKSVAELRREAGVGAPRNSDSLYRDIERAPRKFNPLKVPTSLQAALPFKTKPKLEGKRRRPTLEQKRAVVLEPEERKKVTLLQQLNAIRNKKAEVRRDQRARGRAKLAKRVEVEETWKKAYNKEERKKRYVEEAAKKKAKKPRV